MKKDSEFADYVVEIMQSVGPVYAKRMFGGHGIFLEGLMFGLIADQTLYLKVDKESEPEFTDLALEAFSFNKNGKEMKMSYFQAPEEALEDMEVMNLWANKAYSASLRTVAKKKKH
jgi:DNA transformation protein and related proteins